METVTEMKITIPERIDKRLKSFQDKEWNDAVEILKKKAESIFLNEKPTFFPYYTSHGVGHVNVVLAHADNLIPENVLGELNGQSLFVLVAGIILHDIGMHLRVAGAKQILLGNWSNKYIDQEQKKTWDAAWNEYLGEIRRYSAEKMYLRFGGIVKTEMPDLNTEFPPENDRLLVGEFLRRYHHVLAREIQKDGFPTGSSANRVFDENSRLVDYENLAGILAMSHGVPITETENQVYELYGDRNEKPLDVPIFYLMAVLRVADYLDAGSHRVPVAYSEQEKPVPESLSEHTLNKRINANAIIFQKNKAEVNIAATPERTIEFIQLEKWCGRIQQELDMSWAAIARYYGIGEWALSVFQICCNILDTKSRKQFDEKFVTKEARLRADAELLKLLVEPLYQSDPSCGVRELIQNAVDACNERTHVQGTDYVGKVKVSLVTNEPEDEAQEGGFGTLTVTDNGIGMDEKVILNYYLSAGASYRNSDEWLSTYADGTESKIIRNGRFGVGVLATFLLGDRVKVVTWPKDANKGYEFEFDLQPKSLNIKRISHRNGVDNPTGGSSKNDPVGTTITVYLKKDARNKLQEDYSAVNAKQTWLNWYRFRNPIVEYEVNGESYNVSFSQIPGDGETSDGWFDLQVTGTDEKDEKNKYEAVFWGYPHDGFFCNGIRIPWGMEESYPYDDVTIVSPSVSVIDKKGILPMDLARRFLDKDFILLKALRRETVRYTMAQLLGASWGSRKEAVARWKEGIPNVLSTGSGNPAPIVYGKNHYTLMHAPFLGRNRDNGDPLMKSSRLLIFYVKEGTDPEQIGDWIEWLNPSKDFILLPECDRAFDVCNVKNVINEPPFGKQFYNTKLCRVYLDNERCNTWTVAERYKEIGIERVEPPKSFTAFFHKSDKSDESDESDKVPFEGNCWNSQICQVAYEILCGPSDLVKDNMGTNSKDDLWNFVEKYMGKKPWIPYASIKQVNKIAKDYSELKAYIDSAKKGGSPDA